MEKKRSAGVTVVGWIEIIIGLLGTIVFAMCLFSLFWIAAKATHEGEEAMGLLGVIPVLFFTIIFPLFLFAGMGILKLKPWGVKINLIGIPIFTLLLRVFIQIGKNIKDSPIIELLVSLGFGSLRIIEAIVLFFILPIVWYYFTRPSVEKQFRHEEYPERASYNTVILLAWLLIVYAACAIITIMLSNQVNRAWISAFLLMGAIGLLKLKNWARILTILTMLTGAVLPLYTLTRITRISVSLGAITEFWFPMFGTIVIRLLAIIFLTRSKVRKQFK